MDITRFVVIFLGWQPFLLVVVLALMFTNRKRPDYKARDVLICAAAVLVFNLIVGCVQGMRYTALIYILAIVNPYTAKFLRYVTA